MIEFPSSIQVYIVGGYVRDRLLGRTCVDHDFVVVGATPQIMTNLGFSQVGADFPVFLHPVTGDEFALARTERKMGVGYHGFVTDHTPSVTLQQDLQRRDLTINSMARRVIRFDDNGHGVLDDEIIDPFNGIRDLANKKLRHTSDAFKEDPLRILRVARFGARYKFKIDNATMKLMSLMCDNNELEHVSKERVWDETTKAIAEKNPKIFFDVLNQCGAFKLVFPTMRFPDIDFTPLTTKQRIIVAFADSSAALLDKLKVPNDIKKLVIKYNTLNTKLTGRQTLQPSTVIDIINSIDGYRQINSFMLVLHTLKSQNLAFEKNINLIADAVASTCRITFNSLTLKEQRELKGQQIAQAINRYRIKALTNQESK